MRAGFPSTRLLPSLTDVAFAMPLVYLFTAMNGARSLLGDGDTGWHVRTGEWILDHGQVPWRDPFSYTRPEAPWIAWEWLWDLGAGALHRQWGMGAVVWASAAVIALTFALLYRLLHRTGGQPLPAIAITLAAAAAGSLHWLARPHLVSGLLVVAFLALLERARDGRTGLLWLLPPAAALWTNLHGGFLAGIALALCYTAGAWAERGRRAARPFAAAAAGCVLASLANPYGWRLHQHLFAYLSDPRYYEGIAEFQSVSFHPAMARYFEALLILGVGAAFWSLWRRRFTDALVVLAWAHLALVSARHIPIFAVAAAPALARALSEWMQRAPRLARWRESGRRWSALERLPRWHVASVLLLAALALALDRAPGYKFRARYDPRRYPVEAVARLQGPAFARSVFTHDDWGDYLIYRGYPNIRVFVDGRSDFYGVELEREYARVLGVRHDWERILRAHGVDTVLLPPDTALAGALKESRRWSAVYDDGVAVVFRAAAQSAALGGDDGRDREITKLSTQPRPEASRTAFGRFQETQR